MRKWIIASLVVLALLATALGAFFLGRSTAPINEPTSTTPAASAGQSQQTSIPTEKTETSTQIAPASPTAAPDSSAPYNLPPQPQVGHPSLYLETGVPDPYGINVDQNTKHWRIELLPGTVAIVGGFEVDGVSNGVYKAIAGPGVLDTTVTDGFVAITKAEWANAEFCFRLAQATQFNWAHQTVIPLPGWAACN